MSSTLKVENCPPGDGAEEAVTVTFADGHSERIALYDYDRIYAVPGLYEAIIQRHLECASPAKLAEVLLSVAASQERSPESLRVLDLGAGNGVVGEELRARGVRVLVGTDMAPRAMEAAERDRPGLYADYLVVDANSRPASLAGVVRSHSIDCIVSAGSFGPEHIAAHAFAELWDLLPGGALFAITVKEAHLTADTTDELALICAGGAGSEILVAERFRHRLTVTGAEIHYMVVAARKRSS